MFQLKGTLPVVALIIIILATVIIMKKRYAMCNNEVLLKHGNRLFLSVTV